MQFEWFMVWTRFSLQRYVFFFFILKFFFCLKLKIYLFEEKENKSLSEIERYDQKKKMSKAFGTIAISFIVVIYGTVILIDINWRLLYRLARKGINKIIILIQIVHKKLKK